MTEAISKVPAIYSALAKVQASVPTLQKNGVGPSTQGGYKFLAVDDVLAAIRPLLVENGIVVVPNLADKGFHYNTAQLKDNERVARESIQAWVEYSFEFISTEDGSSVFTRVIGEGIDTQDKAIRKATTSAWKIALIQTFALITGEPDPDSKDGAHEAQTEPARQSQAVQKIAQATNPATGSADNEWTAKIREWVTTGGTPDGTVLTGAQVKAVAASVHGPKGDKAELEKWIRDPKKSNAWKNDIGKSQQVHDAIVSGVRA